MSTLLDPSFLPLLLLLLLSISFLILPLFLFFSFPTSISPSSVSFPVLHLVLHLPSLLLHLLPLLTASPLLFSSFPSIHLSSSPSVFPSAFLQPPPPPSFPFSFPPPCLRILSLFLCTHTVTKQKFPRKSLETFYNVKAQAHLMRTNHR